MGNQKMKGRYTTPGDRDVTVFVIGMKINKWRAVHKGLPVLIAMPPMIKELSINKELGCMGIQSYIQFPTTMMIQYWNSKEQLLAYAKAPKHLKAWRTFNKRTKGNDAVGIYHETYIVPKGAYESIYVNMPSLGLGKALGTEPVTKATGTANERMGRTAGK
ncbi:protein of unknown function [Marinococcus luteus]|uniref:DUF4188 domain-containing protein n=1 Tax=Marinococcus luteus TaxID=1122204 RepID=A0A1H2WUX7_9BACI|nr:DUF4188 domain-containing protein [Marinococcus luteus]SDW84371.1 protein of unknown function [Marinococcus luteus]